MTTLEFSYSLQKLSSSLKPFAMKLTRDVDDANDLLQDTMVKAFTNRDKFTEGTNLKAWLYTIMKNTFINNYRRKSKQNTIFDNSPNEFLLDHLYVRPSAQGSGIGAAVLIQVFQEADNAALPIKVGALKESASNRFYTRHGFQFVESSEFDNYYVRPHRAVAGPAG